MTVDYGGVEVNWSGEEWDRIRAIKDAPGWGPSLAKKAPVIASIHIEVRPELKDKLKAYAKEHGVTLANLIRNVLEVFACE